MSSVSGTPGRIETAQRDPDLTALIMHRLVWILTDHVIIVLPSTLHFLYYQVTLYILKGNKQIQVSNFFLVFTEKRPYKDNLNFMQQALFFFFKKYINI